jgi:putative transposase
MSPRFNPDKHRRRSIRLKGYDYSRPGAFFITICCYQRISLFGEIIDGNIQLTPSGRIALQEWKRLPNRFPSIGMGSFVIMPNHIHGIIIIRDLCGGTARTLEEFHLIGIRRAPMDATIEKFGRPVAGSIPTIVRSYKSSVSYRANRLRQRLDHPVWQRNYYEHVIRNNADWERIDTYIQANPHLWDKDEINPNRVGKLNNE